MRSIGPLHSRRMLKSIGLIAAFAVGILAMCLYWLSGHLSPVASDSNHQRPDSTVAGFSDALPGGYSSGIVLVQAESSLHIFKTRRLIDTIQMPFGCTIYSDKNERVILLKGDTYEVSSRCVVIGRTDSDGRILETVPQCWILFLNVEGVLRLDTMQGARMAYFVSDSGAVVTSEYVNSNKICTALRLYSNDGTILANRSLNEKYEYVFVSPLKRYMVLTSLSSCRILNMDASDYWIIPGGYLANPIFSASGSYIGITRFTNPSTFNAIEILDLANKKVISLGNNGSIIDIGDNGKAIVAYYPANTHADVETRTIVFARRH
jgi:hypothetical protein